MATFGERLKLLREEKGLSQAELGKLYNLSQSTIAYYETNNKQPSNETLQNLANFFQTTTDYLLGRSDVRNPGLFTDPEVITLARARQKMTPEQRAKWDRINKEIFPEAFDNDDK
jgi:transcriptional regulator with XRE-family HTH domain